MRNLSRCIVFIFSSSSFSVPHNLLFNNFVNWVPQLIGLHSHIIFYSQCSSVKLVVSVTHLFSYIPFVYTIKCIQAFRFSFLFFKSFYDSRFSQPWILLFVSAHLYSCLWQWIKSAPSSSPHAIWLNEPNCLPFSLEYEMNYHK